MQLYLPARHLCDAFGSLMLMSVWPRGCRGHDQCVAADSCRYVMTAITLPQPQGQLHQWPVSENVEVTVLSFDGTSQCMQLYLPAWHLCDAG
eukprot:6390557-Amphidinium_carterae.1